MLQRNLQASRSRSAVGYTSAADERTSIALKGPHAINPKHGCGEARSVPVGTEAYAARLAAGLARDSQLDAGLAAAGRRPGLLIPSATMAANIAMGCLDRADAWDEIHSAAEAAGVVAIVARLPQGYRQQLRKWFQGGTELSVGRGTIDRIRKPRRIDRKPGAVR